MPVLDVITEYAVRYGFQVLGAAIVFAAGALIARWTGKLTQQWLQRQEMEPPVRMLLVKAVQVVIMLFAVMAALGQLGVQIAPLLAGVGVAGLGIGLALQGVFSNVVAGLSIIFTKPYRVGEHISLLGVEGDVQAINLFSTILLIPIARSLSFRTAKSWVKSSTTSALSGSSILKSASPIPLTSLRRSR